jgi:alcohol dehydrogenase
MAIVDWRVYPGIAIDDSDADGWHAPGVDRRHRYGRPDARRGSLCVHHCHSHDDACAQKAIELIAKYLRKALPMAPTLKPAKPCVSRSSWPVWLSNNASLGHVHAMAHQLGGFYDLPHGESMPILLPPC